MADESSSQEKTEQATPKRKKELRERGTVARSQELGSTFILLASTLFLYFGAKYIMMNTFEFSKTIFNYMPNFSLNDQKVMEIFNLMVSFTTKTLAPLFIIVSMAGILINGLQVGLVFSSKALEPKLDRIDPISGFKRLLSVKSVVELIKAGIKIIIVGVVCYVTIKGFYSDFIVLSDSNVANILAFFGKTAFKLLIRCIIALGVLSLFDYIYERWYFDKNAMMTKREIKEELKQTEGNPQIKAKIRSIQQRMARQRMMSKVKDADVVITNPTHFAVAIQYIPAKMTAPKVIAKGSMLIAKKIIEIARAKNIPIVENKPLAQALYKSVDIGKEIPIMLYKAVAEILAYVYRLKRRNPKA